jgi:hypothetical protein
MSGDQLATFTDRREAIALFDHLRGRDPNKPWPLLPILAFLGLGGSGKSTLIKYLAAQKCCLPDGRAALPYVYLDFTLDGFEGLQRYRQSTCYCVLPLLS